MTILHLVRHGESEWHQHNRYAGHSDVSLTERGRLQAEKLIPWARAIAPDAIYSSDLRRAIDTARPMSRDVGIELIVDERFREVNYGDVEGLTPLEMAETHVSLREHFVRFPAETKMPNGESGIEALSRAIPGVIEISTKYGGGNVIIVCHGTLMRLIACWMLGINLNDYRRVFPKIVNGARISLQIYNRTNSANSCYSAGLLEFTSGKLDQQE